MNGFTKCAVFAAMAVAISASLFLMSSRVGADFHIVQINQLMAGALGDDDIEFIEIKMLGSRQNCQGGAGQVFWWPLRM